MEARRPMRVVFFGSGAFGLPTLGALCEGHEVVGVVTQPDRPAGRGKALTPTPVGRFAAERLPGVEVLRPERVNEGGVRDRIRSWDADAWVVIAFGQKLGESLLADRFAVNLHASLLPRWRGASPINAAMLAGDLETGVSVITLAREMDAGLVLGQRRRVIDPTWTAGELHDVLAEDGVGVVLEVLEGRAAGRVVGVSQDAGLVTLAPKLGKADGWIDFSESAEACRLRVHGLTPWPGVGIVLGGVVLKVLRVGVEPLASGAAAGTLMDGSGLIACGGGGGLRLLEVLPAGGRAMDFASFARGRGVAVGAVARSERERCARSGT